MSTTSLGDLAQSFMLRHRNTALKQDMMRLTEELSTGQVADVRQALAGNYSYITELERNMEVLGAYQVATTEARIFAEITQTALGRYEEVGEKLANSLIVSGTSTVGAQAADTAEEARVTVSVLIGTLNTKSAGRSIFGGTATDRPATASAETLLTELKAAIAGAATPADMFSAAQAWFDDPAGFDSVIYQGAADTLAPVQLSDSDIVSFDTRATDARLKDMLRFASLAALAEDPSFGFSGAQKSKVFVDAGTSLLGARDSVISLRSRTGFIEAQIEGISTRNAAEITSTEFEKSALLKVDPFEAATKLEEVQFQLQSLYSVTVRMSQLSLVNFL